jgi:guanine deaminase
MPTLFGTLLQPASITECRITPDSLVRFADNGTIATVERGRPDRGDCAGDADCWIIPGFVDAHLHVPHWDRRGIDGLGLFDWQQKIGFPAEARFARKGFATEFAEQFTSGIIANGTTTVVGFGSPFAEEVDATFDVFDRRGLRVIYGMMLNDLDVPQELMQVADKALDESRALAAKWHKAGNGRLLYAFSPRASIRCSERLMRGAAALAQMLTCWVQTHVAESLEEGSQVTQRFPDQVDELDLFAEMGMLFSRTILAHGVFLDHQERRMVADRKTAIVHCPTANLFRQSGLMDYMAHRAAGIRIALGSSIAGGPDPFMPRVAVEGLQTAKAIKVHSLPRRIDAVPTPAEAWWMLTAGGASAIGLGDHVGTIAAGYQGDCLVVRPERWIKDLPPEQQVSALLYSIQPSQIEHVFIAGRRVGPA